jgi:hypothetical protein
MVGALWSVLCRLSALEPSRETACVAVQHMALGMGLFCGLVLPGAASQTSLVIGVAAYLALGAPRWRHGAPGGLGPQLRQ